MNDSIFGDFVIDEFERLIPGQNLYWVVLPSTDASIQYIRQREKVTPFVPGCYPDPAACRAAKAVFFHSLNGGYADVMNFLEPSAKVFWFPWGYDIYPYCWEKTKIYQPLTFGFYSEWMNRRTTLFKKIMRLISRSLTAKRTRKDWRTSAIARVDYCSPIVPTEYPIVQTLPGFRAKPVRFHYGTIESVVRDIPELTESPEDIFIGNSNTMASNHADAFRRVAETGFPKGKIIVPLSYGDGDDYHRFVVDRGKYYFGPRFFPISEFMNLKEYCRILSSCRIAVFNHMRQQGLGTVMMMLWLGAAVYLNSTNPIYGHLIEIGISPRDFSRSFETHIRVDSDELRIIRQHLSNEYGEVTVRARIKKIADLTGVH
ncbi:TDP-N-acetylfucosamine:lipid II N-acetylfucosaminyltransferase [bacterium]|nr:TDP-N-acetylfucosamine:lipid II N-acetylfucosaminyltransferase [candidate division CSSED10-310 bacterium]